MKRISYLDGHRGIAILLVIVFHAYSRWSEIMPYGSEFSEFPVFRYGYLGVQLFFLISGFVILMTLEKCQNVRGFLYRRWLRLFPAMLICSLLIYMTAGLFYERPKGQPAIMDLIPGLLFVEPYVWLKLTGLEMSSLENSFWSLYVEVKFYVVASILYFRIGSQKLVIGLFLCFLSWVTLRYFDGFSPYSGLYSIADILGFEYFGWFSAGAAYYLYVKSDKNRWFVCGLLFSFISSLVESNLNLQILIAAMFISSFFALSIISVKLQMIISNRIFLYLGFVSYPLYLLHENMMISIVLKVWGWTQIIPGYLLPILAIVLIVSLSKYVSTYLEPRVKNSLSAAVKRIRLQLFPI